jgi:hypothetical protein
MPLPVQDARDICAQWSRENGLLSRSTALPELRCRPYGAGYRSEYRLPMQMRPKYG